MQSSETRRFSEVESPKSHRESNLLAIPHSSFQLNRGGDSNRVTHVTHRVSVTNRQTSLNPLRPAIAGFTPTNRIEAFQNGAEYTTTVLDSTVRLNSKKLDRARRNDGKSSGGGGGEEDEDDRAGSQSNDSRSSTASTSSVFSFVRNPCAPPRGHLAVSLQYESLFLLSGDNPARLLALNFVRSKPFETFILLSILTNCVTMALQDPTQKEPPRWQEILDLVFVGIFSLEMVLKTIGMGFVLHPGAYLRDSWNVLDFIIVLLAYLQLLPQVGNFTAIRLLRVLRPLRSLNAIPRLKLLVKCLFESVRALGNVFLLAMFTLSIFAILAVQLFQGNWRWRCQEKFSGEIQEFMFCSPSGSPDLTFGRACPPDFICVEHQNPDFGFHGFDNFGQVFIIIFQVVTLDTWGQTMWESVAHSGWPISLWYIFLVLFGNYLLLNLNLAVINFEFEEAKNAFAEQQKAELEAEEARAMNSGEGNSDEKNAEARIALMNVIYLDGAPQNMANEELSECSAQLSITIPGRLILELHKESFQEVVGLQRHPSVIQGNDELRDVLEKRDSNVESVSGESISFPQRFPKIFRAWTVFRSWCYQLSEGDLFETHAVQLHNIKIKLERLEKGESGLRHHKSLAETDATLFQKFIIAIIIANTVLLGADHYGASDTQLRVSDLLNQIFTWIFFGEFLIRITALTPIGYGAEGMNLFDGVITLVSVAETFIGSGMGLSVFRGFRLLRAIRLVKAIPALRSVIAVTLFVMQETAYLSLFLFLYIFIAAVVGMQLFGGSLPQEWQVRADDKSYTNYDNFLTALYAAMQVLTYDNVQTVMFRVMGAVGTPALVYFYICTIFGGFVIANLWLAMLIGSFDEMDEESPNSTEETDDGAGGGGTVERKGDGPTDLLHLVNPSLPATAPGIRVLAEPVERFLAIKEGRSGSTAKGMENAETIVVPELHKASSFVTERKILAEEVCGVCGEPMQRVLTPCRRGSHVLSVEKLHERMCGAMSARQEKTKTVLAILKEIGVMDPTDVLDIFGDVKASVDVSSLLRGTKKPNPSFVEGVFGKAWESGALLEESIDDYLCSPTWEPLVSVLLDVLHATELRAGEEQVGRGLLRYSTSSLKENLLTNGGDSLWVFGPKNSFRALTTWMTSHPIFEGFIILCILVSSIAMAMSNPRNSDSAIENDVELVGNIFTVIFATEAVLKIISLGFLFHPTAYLRDGWNVLDFFVVVIAVAAWALSAVGSVNIGYLRVFRTLRAVRPLRLVNKNRGLKMTALALIQSIQGITAVAFVALIIYYIFAILGVQLFAGRFHSCNDLNITSRSECIGNFTTPTKTLVTRERQVVVNGTLTVKNVTAFDVLNVTANRRWASEPFNFDNTYNAMFLLYRMGTQDGWSDIAYRAIDATDPDHGPIRGNSVVYGLYFVVFILIGSMFTMNLFVGVIIFNFQSVKEKMDGSSLLTSEQKLWVETQRMMLNFRPKRHLRRKEHPYQQWCYQLVNRQGFELFTSGIVLANIVFIALQYYNQPDSITNVFAVSNYVFVSLFAVECFLKISAYDSDYFKDWWNRFDFFIVMIGILDIVAAGFLPFSVAIRSFRIFRIARILTLFKRTKDISILIETLWYSLPSLVNVGTFLGLVLFVYAVLGVQLFSQVKQTWGLTPDINFETFGHAFMFLLMLSTFDNWGYVMVGVMNQVDCGPSTNSQGVDDCGTPIAPLFFVSFCFLAGSVMLNLFVAVILDNFETTQNLNKSKLKIHDLKKFVDGWSLFDPDATMIVPTHKFSMLLAALQPPLGIPRKSAHLDLLRLTQKYDIPEHGGVIHFVETMIPLARAVQGVSFTAQEIREHEEFWRVQFPDIRDLPLLRYRQKRVSVDQYYAATLIASAYRRQAGSRSVEYMRSVHTKELLSNYEQQRVSESERTILIDRARRDRIRQKEREATLLRAAALAKRQQMEAEEEAKGGEVALDPFLIPQFNSLSATPATTTSQAETSVKKRSLISSTLLRHTSRTDGESNARRSRTSITGLPSALR